jgi:hypothetical protein
MEIFVKKEVNELYYLATRWGGGKGWDSQKTFVRTDYSKKSGKLGSCMYCSADYTAIMFSTYEDAVKMMNKYNCSGERVKLFNFNKYLRNNKLVVWGRELALKEMEIEGIKCYKFI